jgi:hypothetical protein
MRPLGLALSLDQARHLGAILAKSRSRTSHFLSCIERSRKQSSFSPWLLMQGGRTIGSLGRVIANCSSSGREDTWAVCP